MLMQLYFGERAKKVLSKDAQDAIANLAGSATTKAALLCAGLVAVILSPFVEQQRWPFSYPSDPKVYVDNDALRNKINQQSGEIGAERELARASDGQIELRGIPAGVRMWFTSGLEVICDAEALFAGSSRACGELR